MYPPGTGTHPPGGVADDRVSHPVPRVPAAVQTMGGGRR
ncbi:hypothetical protein SCATT_55120 [Streptantibioticus cattleyicolor NRRL 8057 = DSM 46488]|uniref:Uncharacterized protein n=1 Tax=Streptantibioticus cattleyicolor (strain ATCC 35852 / DSM 46488 / JCM 4925 / NBRC 14057 / NRRL 8057) TaxID=1003195 RepID=G8WYB3_STREN|nr:hypothetical protein SCATT_55120 [Streptantibioticus cattleyicolor NRRL 8057 = DSM 46488]